MEAQAGRGEVLASERRWSLPVALMTLGAVAALLASGFASGAVHGEGDAEVLRSAHAHASALTLSAVLQAIGFALFVPPLFYLFRAVQARSDRVRGWAIGLSVAAPLCLAVSSGVGAAARSEAATQFVDGKAKSTLSASEAKGDCASQLRDKGARSFGEEFEPARGETALAACERRKVEDDEASNASSEASLLPLATGFGILGGLSLIAALFYTCLWALRTGVLSRFWGALGMALGITVLLGVVLFLLVWLLYVGLLIGGWIPGGRPPAWAAGEAIPWPTPGEKAAAALGGPGEE